MRSDSRSLTFLELRRRVPEFFTHEDWIKDRFLPTLPVYLPAGELLFGCSSAGKEDKSLFKFRFGCAVPRNTRRTSLSAGVRQSLLSKRYERNKHWN